ncbi:glycosyltransferase family 4 protein [Sphingomonas sp.]|uniref:glycosyltransferase family 4 protein n=1 Tax=Sphingomonas sp. TaxID=28214 RepID=UPI002E36DF6E|nr:glycosyltransferase family 4 protein [Sphingomonas sp.]HEX4695908.1 glycosyltransferase family 4 protein [Sphingomonas sp.]
MRILALSHYYPPEVNAPASRLSEHAHVWREAGHEVTVVTCAPNHPAGALYPGYRNRLWQEETIDGIRVIRLWTWLAPNEGFVRRIANYVSYMLSVLVWMWRFPKADMVMSTSPQFFCGLAGWLLKRRRCPWVLEIRDLWPESIVMVGAMKRGFAIRLLEAIEAFAYRHADLVVSVTDGFVPHIRTRRPHGPIAVIKNGADLSHFTADRAAADAFRAEHGLTGKFVASYVGTHGMAHGLDTVIAAAERLRHRNDIAILMVGGGAERERLRAARDQRGLANIVMVGQMPKAAMPAIWGASDAALVLLKRVDTFKTVIPSKMFEAMALGVPMILGVEGEAKALMDAGAAGIAITPEDDTQLAAAIERLADDRTLGERIGASARAYVRANFDRETLARDYLAAFEAVAR